MNFIAIGPEGGKETEGEKESPRPTGFTCIPVGPARRTKYLFPDTIDTDGH